MYVERIIKFNICQKNMINFKDGINNRNRVAFLNYTKIS